MVIGANHHKWPLRSLLESRESFEDYQNQLLACEWKTARFKNGLFWKFILKLKKAKTSVIYFNNTPIEVAGEQVELGVDRADAVDLREHLVDLLDDVLSFSALVKLRTMNGNWSSEMNEIEEEERDERQVLR